jgi:hypothetical protein
VEEIHPLDHYIEYYGFIFLEAFEQSIKNYQMVASVPGLGGSLIRYGMIDIQLSWYENIFMSMLS